MNPVPNNLIYQCRLGNFPKSVFNSVESVGKYAKKIGVTHEFAKKTELKGLDESISMHLYFNILHLIYDKKFDKYDDILYLDTDIIVDPDAENIFDIHKNKNVDVMGIYEKKLGDSGPAFNEYYWKKLFHAKYKRFNIPIIRKNIHQINTGVVLFTKKGRLKARERFDDWIPWASDPIHRQVLDNDQPFLNAMFEKYQFNVMAIDDVWNMPVAWFITSPCPKSNFYHFSGGTLNHLVNEFNDDNTPAGKKFKII